MSTLLIVTLIITGLCLISIAVGMATDSPIIAGLGLAGFVVSLLASVVVDHHDRSEKAFHRDDACTAECAPFATIACDWIQSEGLSDVDHAYVVCGTNDIEEFRVRIFELKKED